jgi:hypothetical protein
MERTVTCPAGSPDCGYVSDGTHDQADWEHMHWEHRTCADCGREPRDGDSVTHLADCPRLQPGYVYPERRSAP